MEEKYINQILKEADKAAKKGEVPIGCVIVKNNKVIAKSHNTKETTNVATNHAEIIAIKKACKKINSWRLNDCILYVTLKPCNMCMSAIKEARISKVIYLLDSNYEHQNNYNIDLEQYIKENDYAIKLKDFFNKLR